MAETTATLQEKLKALTHGKVDILLDADTFKNTTQILREMSSVWEEMTDMEQAAALELLGGKRQANILSSLISNFKTVEDVIETSMNSSGSAIAENEKYMDSIAGKSEQFTNAMQALWNNTINSDMIKYFLDLALGATKVVDAIGMLPSTLAAVLVYFTAFKKQSPAVLFKDMYLHLQNYQQALYKLNTLNKLNLNLGMPGKFNITAVNAYAAAVSNLTAKKQAEALATSGLNKAQIAEIMSRNGIKDSVIQETLSKMNLASTNQTLHTTTVAQAVASRLSADAMKEQTVADFLAANGKKKLTAKILAQMVQQKILTSEQAANIASSYALAGANNVLGASFKTVGLAIKSMFLSNPVGLIMMIVSGVAMAVTKIKQIKEDAIQAAEETVSAYTEAQKTLKEQKKTIDELSDSYERLSKGVDLDTNNNVSLTTDSYKEYLNICNEIADMYPHLVTGYDAQGNAILSLKGNVDELIEAYREAAQLARQQMIFGGNDVFSSFKTTYDNDPTTVFESTGVTQQIKMAQKLLELIKHGSDQEIQSFFDTIEDYGVTIDGQQYKNVELFDTLEAMGIDTGWFNTGFQNWMGAVDIDEFKQYASKITLFLESTTAKINTETSKVKSLLSAYLGEDADYASYGDKTRAYIDQIISGLDVEFIAGFDNPDALYNDIKTNIVDVFKDPEVTDALSDLSELQLEFTDGDIAYSDYQAQLAEHLEKIQNKFDEDSLSQIKVGLGINEESLATAANHIQTLLYGQDFVGPIASDIQEKINSLSVEDLQIAGQLEVPDGVVYSWDELIGAIERARIAAAQEFDITNYTDAITAHSAAVSEYQEALQKLDKGSFTMDDFMSLIKKYPELAKGVDISSNAFHGLAHNLNGAVKTSTKSFIKDLKNLKVSLDAAGKSTESIDQLIESIENMSLDALDNTIQKYGTLADAIDRAKTSNNQLLASMEENPNENYENRGEAMDYMKEAMKKGEIGSESNLWNVAKNYGFTYDSAKTMNENADALAKFIAVREKWFATADDGDDRTDDGYSFKGIESYIETVESAVNNSPELQKLLEWDYDENKGNLKFDYDNKNLKEIVSLLGDTESLVGLTESEFMDLMQQIGQYFELKWSDYDDAVDHLNDIANGADDAKTKIEEYQKYMQEHFGKNTEIDLTARPMVSKAEMHDAGWDKFEGDYATLYSGGYSSKDGSVIISATPILPDGKILDKSSLERYATEIANGTKPAELTFEYKGKTYTGEDIVLNKFEGPNAKEQEAQYGKKLSEAQAGYDQLRDTLGINATLIEKGIDGLKEIEGLQGAVDTNSDGVTVIDENAFTAILEEAGYAEDQIDLIIEKIKALNGESFTIDSLNIDEALSKNGIEALTKVKELQDAIKKDADTGLTAFDAEIFASVLDGAGYTKAKVKELIETIQTYETVISVSGKEDPLGLNDANKDAETLKATLNLLGIEYSAKKELFGDGINLDINVNSLITTLSEKGWNDEQIKSYLQQLSSDETEGVNIKIDGKVSMSDEEIDAAIKKSKEIPEEEKINVELTGTALTDAQNINAELDKMQDKTVDITINETTVKKTEEDDGFNLFKPSTWFANGTAHASGTAFAGGNWGAPKTETALVGELGPEVIVRGNKWTTVGDNGAEFTQVKKGDIIFNHKQTESLLKNGYVTSRGKLHGGAFASGTAYATTDSTFFSYDFSGSGGYTKYDVNDSAVDSWGDLSGSISDASDAANEFEETLDWIEIRIEEINEQLDLMNAQLENADDYASKNNIIDQIMGVNKNKMANLMAGIQKYSEYAAKLLADVPAKYRDAAQDGAIAITEFVGEADEKTVEAIEKYREWAQKVANLKQELEGVKTEIRDLAIQKIDNIQDFGSAKTSIEDAQTEKLQNRVDLDEEMGLITSPAYYTAMMENSGKKIEYWQPLLEDMQKELDEAVKTGRIQVGSVEWYEQLAKLYEVQSEIDTATIELEEFQNAINDIYWDNFDELINRIGYLKDETQSLIDLMDDEKMVTTPETEDGWAADQVEWTKEGIATMGLLAQQMEMSEYEAEQYAQAIDDLTADYEKGLYSESEYLEKLNELKKGQHDSIESYKDSKKAIVDLHKTRVDEIKNGIEKEVKAYEELIKKKKEDLSTEKDLYDFQKRSAESSKNIADIQRKLAALSGDNSASAIAKRKKLEAELAEAKSDQEELYYERSIENQQSALDKELESFQTTKDAEMEKWEEYLTNVEQVVADSLNVVQTNATEIGSTLTAKAEEYNLTVSDAVLSPWKDGALAVDAYQSAFGTSMSSTMDQLDLLKGKWQAVIDKMAEAGKIDVSNINAENAQYAAAEKAPDPKPAAKPTPNNNKAQQAKAAPSVGGTVTVKKSATHFGSKSKGLKMASFVPGGSYTVYQTSGDQVLIGRNGVYTGWVKLTDLNGYAKGTTGVDEDQWALLDELGEELVLNAGPDGRLQYLSKGTAVLTHDLTERLMDLAMNPQEVLDRSRPTIAPSKSVVNNNMEIHIDASVGELIHVDHLEGNNLDEINKFVDKAWDKKMQGLNKSIKKFVR